MAFKTRTSGRAYIAVDVKNTEDLNDQDAEIPRFEQICYQNLLNAPQMSARGDITFFTPKGATVPLRFRLDQVTGKRRFNHTRWKDEKSAWMRKVRCSDKPVVLNPGEWPSGYDAAKVKDLTLEISLPPLQGKKVCYQYALHLDLKTSDKKTTVDIGIDPQIINHPE